MQTKEIIVYPAIEVHQQIVTEMICAHGDASGSENNGSNLQLPTKSAVPMSIVNRSSTKSDKKHQILLSLGSIRCHKDDTGRNKHTPVTPPILSIV
jgi:hypothetical protein